MGLLVGQGEVIAGAEGVLLACDRQGDGTRHQGHIVIRVVMMIRRHQPRRVFQEEPALPLGHVTGDRCGGDAVAHVLPLEIGLGHHQGRLGPGGDGDQQQRR
ncbi:hypothetical protein D3C80_1632370 [compost metagenome]